MSKLHHASRSQRGPGAHRDVSDALRKQRGANLVEAALVLPVLLLVLIGIVEFGYLYSNYEALTHAARNGARFAVTPVPGPGSPTPPQTAASVARQVCSMLVGPLAPNTCSTYDGAASPPSLTTCVISGGPGPSTDDIYVSQCSVLQANSITITFTEVDIRKTVNLPLLPAIPLHTTVAMRNETN